MNRWGKTRKIAREGGGREREGVRVCEREGERA